MQSKVHWKNQLLIDFLFLVIEVVALREGTHCNFFFNFRAAYLVSCLSNGVQIVGMVLLLLDTVWKELSRR